MSTVGQALGGLVGGIAGFFLGGPMGALRGAQAGIMLGGYLDPPKGPQIQGPRLDDLSVQTSTYGAFIPRGYGTFPVTGNVFWLENNKLKEKKKTQKAGGKGGGGGATTTTYSYYATFAVGLLDCSDGQPIQGVRRIWIAGRKWYDAGTDDVDEIRASNVNATKFSVYTGAEDQEPDPRMQAKLGIANCSAFRGLAYLVFYDLPLAKYGNSLMGAQVKVEIVKSGTVSYQSNTVSVPIATDYTDAVAYGDGLFFAPKYGMQSVITSDNAQTWKTVPLPAVTNQTTWEAAAYGMIYPALPCYVLAGVGERFLVSHSGEGWYPVAAPALAHWGSVCFGDDRFVATAYNNNLAAVSTDGGETWAFGTLPYTRYRWNVAYGDHLFVAVASGSGADGAWSVDGFTWTYFGMAGGANVESVAYGNGVWVALSTSNDDVFTSPDGATWTRHVALLNTGDGNFGWTNLAFGDGQFVATRNGLTTFATSPDGLTWTIRTAVADFSMALCYGDGVFVSPDGTDGHATLLLGERLASAPVTLASIVQAECLASGLLQGADIDVSDLTATVRGYRVGSLGALRASIEPLRAAFPFDVVQSGFQIAFRPRGGSVVATIAEADLGAGADGKPEVRFTEVREMDTQIPRRVAVKYLDHGREYDLNEQQAARLNTESVNVSEIELPVVLTADEAAQAAEKLLYLYWLERRDLAFTLPPTYQALEDADIVSLTADGVTHTLRLTSIARLSDGRLEVKAKPHAAAVYSSSAVGSVGESPGDVLALPGRSLLQVLDLPVMTDDQDAPGYVLAACGRTATWPGCEVQRSDDGGQTWAAVETVEAPGATMGYAVTVIGAGRTDIVDASNRLTVSLVAGELESITLLAMLNGGNHFAYGAPGRWEVIAAQNCVLQGDGSYILSDLLRGRFGTEWAMTGHAVGDAVVLLSTDLPWVSVSSGAIGLERLFRAVTFDQEADGIAAKPFSYAGQNLECLSPVLLGGSRHPSTGDWTLNWTRRTRIGGEWRDYVDASLGEASESYVVEIYDSGYATLKRVLTSTTPTVQYTQAQQVADFGVLQSAVYVKVYQVSASVGTGVPLLGSVAVPVNNDPYWGSVVLLQHFDGAFTDQKGHSVSTGGSPSVSNEQLLFGTHSLKLPAAGDYLSLTYGSDFAMGSADWTIEFWIRFISLNATDGNAQFSISGPSGSRAIDINTAVAGPYFRMGVSADGTAMTNITGGTVIATGTWYHVAFERHANTLRLFVNGSEDATAVAFASAIYGSPSGVYIGRLPANVNAPGACYLEDLRVTKGLARYTANFTPVLQPFANA